MKSKGTLCTRYLRKTNIDLVKNREEIRILAVCTCGSVHGQAVESTLHILKLLTLAISSRNPHARTIIGLK